MIVPTTVVLKNVGIPSPPARMRLGIVFCYTRSRFIADIVSDVFANLSCRQKQAHAKAVHANVVADRGEIFHAFADQGADQIFRNAAQSEAADHDRGAVGNLTHCLVGAGHNFVHKKEILNEIQELGHGLIEPLNH
jgi:hypothetical protein